MSDDWDAYFTHVDGKPATMLLDLGLTEDAPIPGLSILGYVTIDFLDPDENGMSKPGENDRLNALEDALVAALVHDTCIFVGRCTTAGQRDFFFYMDNGKGVEETLEAMMTKFEEYTWDMGLVEEAGWETYLEFLFPDEQGMDSIWNNRIRRNLLAEGDISSLPRVIEHWIQFAAQADMDAFILEAEREGFAVGAKEKKPDARFEVLLRREDVPDDINDVTWPLRELVGAHGGAYDGWGCSVVQK